MQGQEENFSNIAHLNNNQNGEMTREVYQMQSEKNLDETEFSERLSDGTTIMNPIKFMMIYVPNDNESESI